MYKCPHCNGNVTDLVNWDYAYAEDVLCPHCKESIFIDYEEEYYPETNEEFGYWYVKKKADD